MHPAKELTADGRVGAAAQGEVLKTPLVHSRVIAPVVGQHRTTHLHLALEKAVQTVCQSVPHHR